MAAQPARTESVQGDTSLDSSAASQDIVKEGKRADATVSRPTFYRTAVDLRNNRYLAHLHRDGLVVPLSDPGVTKYLPAAKSGLEPHRVGDRRSLRVVGRTGVLLLPLSADLCRKGCWFQLALEQRIQRQFLGIYVNEKALATQPVPKGASVVRAYIPPGVVVHGENRFRFYFSRKGAATGEKLGAELFWLAVTRTKDPDLRVTSEMKRIVGGRRSGLNFRDFFSWSWNLAVPSGSYLELGWQGDGACPVVVHIAWARGGEGRVSASHVEPGLVRFDLAEECDGSGALVGLRIERLRPVVLTRARVVVPHQPMTELGTDKARNIILWLTAGLPRTWGPGAELEGGEIEGATSMARLIKRGVFFRDVEAQSPSPWKSFLGILASVQPHVVRKALADDPRSIERNLLPAVLKKNRWRAVLFSGEGKTLRQGRLRRVFHEILDFDPPAEAQGERTSLGKLEPWLQEHKKGPFFVVVSPWSRQAYYRQRKGYTDPEILRGYRGSLPARLGDRIFSRIRTGKEKLRARDRAYISALAEGEAAFQDNLLGDLISKLEELEIASDTLLVVAGASGAELFEHGGVGFGHSLHVEATRVSMLFVHPKSLPTGMEISVGAELLDLAPTMLSAVGVTPPRSMQGANLLSLIRNPSIAPPRPGFSRRNSRESSLRLEDYRILRTHGAEDQVFDLRVDPTEQTPLRDMSNPSVRALKDAMAFHGKYAKNWHKARHGLPTNHSETFAQDARSWWGR